MKRIITFILSVIMLCTFSGCNRTEPELDEPNIVPVPFSVVPGQTQTDNPDITIQIDGINYNKEEKETSLVVLWHNKTDYDVTYGAAFIVERLDGEKWVNCAKQEELYFHELAYILEAARLKNVSYNLTDTYDISVPGLYRFRTECYYNDGAEKCKLSSEFTVGDIETPNERQDIAQAVTFSAQYIRTNGHLNGTEFPNVQIIRNRNELDSYYKTHKDTIDLERNPDPGADYTVGFLDACDSYDDTFFAENFLILVALEAGSGSIRHNVKDITKRNNKLCISIKSEIPEVCTADMAQWHIIIEQKQDVIVKLEEDILVYWDNRLAWDGKAVHPVYAAFKTPPKGILTTPEGIIDLQLGSYHWFYPAEDDTECAVIADQTNHPLPEECLKPITVESPPPVPGSGEYKTVYFSEFPVKIEWEKAPNSVVCTCWPDTVWQDSSIQGTEIPFEWNLLYPKVGGYIYEFHAVWEDSGDGCYGSANYYVYIIGLIGDVLTVTPTDSSN